MRLIALDCVAIYPQGCGRVSVPKSRGNVGYGNTRPKQTDSEKALALAQEKAVTAVEHFRVSPRVNNAKNQSAELIEPFENPA